MGFKQFLVESKNTLLADINEILLGYHLLGGWKGFNDSTSAKKALEQRRKQVGDESYHIQDLRSQEMSKEVMSWCRNNGYLDKITGAWWTARPNVLSKAVGKPVDSKKNPTDTLIKFSDGRFLGLSAKSTKGKGDIGFKNPGIGTLKKAIDFDTSFVAELENKAVEDFGLPSSKTKRKSFIRQHSDIQSQTIIIGSNILSALRDSLLSSMNRLSQNELYSHIVDNWMDANVVDPPYIKVTGHGNKEGKITASIMDPLKNEKMGYLKKPVVLEKVGSDSIGVLGGGKRIMKIRFKYESEKIASSLKLSGDPW